MSQLEISRGLAPLSLALALTLVVPTSAPAELFGMSEAPPPAPAMTSALDAAAEEVLALEAGGDWFYTPWELAVIARVRFIKAVIRLKNDHRRVHRLTRAQKDALASTFSRSILDRTRVRYGCRFPTRADYRKIDEKLGWLMRKLGIFERLAELRVLPTMGSTSATVIGFEVYIWNDDGYTNQLAELAHEVTHIRQFVARGESLNRMILDYAEAHRKGGGTWQGNAMEEEARGVARKYEE